MHPDADNRLIARVKGLHVGIVLGVAKEEGRSLVHPLDHHVGAFGVAATMGVGHHDLAGATEFEAPDGGVEIGGDEFARGEVLRVGVEHLLRAGDSGRAVHIHIDEHLGTDGGRPMEWPDGAGENHRGSNREHERHRGPSGWGVWGRIDNSTGRVWSAGTRLPSSSPSGC